MSILYSFSRVNGASAAGMCPVEILAPFIDSAALERLCPHAKTVFVVLFPYYAGDSPGNLSLYARGCDYHAVIRGALTPLVQALEKDFPENRFLILADASPIPEVRAASYAGLGCIGENGLLITETYGSFVFIGTVVSDLWVPTTEVGAFRISPCLQCGKCIASCPSGAIQNGHIDASRCLSALTQKSGTLAPEERSLLKQHPLIWGCDICQTVCPMNRGVRPTTNPAFRENLIAALSENEVSGLTRRAFCERFPDRAFTWKGPKPLERNLKQK